jgi:hypothetical protein
MNDEYVYLLANPNHLKKKTNLNLINYEKELLVLLEKIFPQYKSYLDYQLIEKIESLCNEIYINNLANTVSKTVIEDLIKELENELPFR